MDKEDIKRALIVISVLSVALMVTLFLLIETGVIFAEAR